METMERTAQSILDIDATQLARLISQKEITSRGAVEIFIAHIKKINPAVNCLVEDRFAEALEEADQADAQIAAGTAQGNYSACRSA
ncbi:hypothetical protein [Planococcus koreensis]|uniref:hypothetical protein n=1 Tax=Planococcus koreensis TaxID=112331 RepID=UPI0039FCD3A5